MRATLLLLVSLASAAVLDRVAVVVGTDVITEGEVLDALRLTQFLASQPLDLGPSQRRAEADRLIDQQLIRHEMEIVHYKPPAAGEADAMLSNFRQQHFKGNDAAFRRALQSYGLTGDQLKRHLLWQLSVMRFTDERFHPNIQQNSAQFADRYAPGAAPGDDGNGVDEQLNAWLKEARGSTRVVLKKEAFQ